MSKEAEQHNAIDKLAEVYYDTYCKQILSTPREIKRAFKAGFVSGSQSLPKEEDKWVKVEDGLPENKKEVLGTDGKHIYVVVYTKGLEIDVEDFDDVCDFDEHNGTQYLKAGWYEEVQQYSGAYDSIYADRKIIHWQPLPSPPIKPIS